VLYPVTDVTKNVPLYALSFAPEIVINVPGTAA